MLGKNVMIANKTSKFSPVQFLVGTGTMAALTLALLSTATATPKTGARTALEGATHYACGDVCFDRYNTCIGSGTAPATCITRLQYCLGYCMGGGGNGNSSAPVRNKNVAGDTTLPQFSTR